jgi:hypothetical protein
MSKLLTWMKTEPWERSGRTQLKEVRKRSTGNGKRKASHYRAARVVGPDGTAAGSAVAAGEEAETSAMAAVATRA